MKSTKKNRGDKTSSDDKNTTEYEDSFESRRLVDKGIKPVITAGLSGEGMVNYIKKPESQQLDPNTVGTEMLEQKLKMRISLPKNIRMLEEEEEEQEEEEEEEKKEDTESHKATDDKEEEGDADSNRSTNEQSQTDQKDEDESQNKNKEEQLKDRKPNQEQPKDEQPNEQQDEKEEAKDKKADLFNSEEDNKNKYTGLDKFLTEIILSCTLDGEDMQQIQTVELWCARQLRQFEFYVNLPHGEVDYFLFPFDKDSGQIAVEKKYTNVKYFSYELEANDCSMTYTASTRIFGYFAMVVSLILFLDVC